MSYEDNYDQTARWDAESVREAEQRTQHRSTRSSAERQKLKRKGKRRRFALWLAFVLIVSAILAGRDDHRDHARRQPEHHRHEAPRRGAH